MPALQDEPSYYSEKHDKQRENFAEVKQDLSGPIIPSDGEIFYGELLMLPTTALLYIMFLI